MSQFDDEFDEYTSESEAIKNLRQAHKKLSKELEEAKAALQEANKEKRGNTLKSQLEEFGVNPKIAALMPPDLEPSPEAVKGWLSEYGDVFGITPAEEKPTAGFYTEEEKAEIGRINKVDQTTAAPGSPQSMADQISGATSEAELLAILRQAQS